MSNSTDKEYKVCRRCKLSKPLSEYYIYPPPTKSHHACKECTKELARDYYVRNVEKRRAKIVEYSKSEAGRKVMKKAHLKRLEQHPEKILARNEFSKALSRGDLVRQPCEVCGDEKSEGHHYLGYEKEHWFDIQWLCRYHHKEADGQLLIGVRV